MLNILNKEFKLSASILSFLFILFGLMFFLPGYPILVASFFVNLGIFQSFQNTKENNDILFSTLLPINRKDVVKGKYLFVCFIQMCASLLMLLIVIIRMSILNNSIVYRNNALMNANFFALGLVLIIFALFNLIFVNGFFKTAYKFGKPFVSYTILTFLLVGIGETLHHLKGLEFLNAFGTDNLKIQLLLLLSGVVFYVVVTFISYKKSCERFVKIDL